MKEEKVKIGNVLNALDSALHSLSAVHFDMLRLDFKEGIAAQDAVCKAIDEIAPKAKEAGIIMNGCASEN